MKSPPAQHPDDLCRDKVEAFIAEHAKAAAAAAPRKRTKK
jgi:hypothetical protein